VNGFKWGKNLQRNYHEQNEHVRNRELANIMGMRIENHQDGAVNTMVEDGMVDEHCKD